MSGGRIGRRPVALAGGPAAVLELDRGTGTPVVLLHGFAGDLLTWQFNLSAVSLGRRAIAVDLPGHGESTLDVGDGGLDGFAAWVGRVLDALALPRAHLVGHSMGGAIAVRLAERCPERVASLSLIACAGLGPLFDLALLRRLPVLADEGQALDCAAAVLAEPAVMGERLARVLLAQAADPRRRAALEAIVAGSFLDLGGGAPVAWDRLAMPVQLLWGGRDRVIPLPPADRLPAAAPLHLFDNAGHMPHSEAAGPVNAVLRDFLAACDARGYG